MKKNMKKNDNLDLHALITDLLDVSKPFHAVMSDNYETLKKHKNKIKQAIRDQFANDPRVKLTGKKQELHELVDDVIGKDKTPQFSDDDISDDLNGLFNKDNEPVELNVPWEHLNKSKPMPDYIIHHFTNPSPVQTWMVAKKDPSGPAYHNIGLFYSLQSAEDYIKFLKTKM